MIHVSKITFVLSKSSVKAVTDRAVNAGLNRAAGVAVRAIKQSFSKNGKFRPSAPGSPPNRNSSLLFNSISATKAENKVVYVYSSGVAYAKKHEQPPGTSGLIKAKSSKYLTIPMNDQAARMRERTTSLRVLNLTYIPGKHRGVAFLWLPKGKGKRMKSTLMFMLKPSVRLPPRPFLRPAFNNPTVRAEMTKAFCQGSKMALLGTLT
jgi:hypothetical protein